MHHFTGTFDLKPPPHIWPEKISRGLKSSGRMIHTAGPGFATAGNNTLLFAGEIYNLEGSPDNKAAQILTALIKQGPSVLRTYDGEFTLIQLSEAATLIFRDRHGAGPQVYYTEKYFSSSLENLLSLDDFRPEPDHGALQTFLTKGFIPSPMTALRGTRKIPAGELLKGTPGKKERKQLFKWEDYQQAASHPSRLTVEEATRKYGELHQKAIEKRIKGKNHVGLLLSGGYDSGGNIAGLREMYNGNVSTFSIGFKDNPWTELPLARLLSEKYHTNHHQYEIDGSEIKELPDIVNSLGDPFQEGGLMVNHAAMKLTQKNKPDVILGGDGNDQHFGTSGKELALRYWLQKKGMAPLQKIYAHLGKWPVFDKDNVLFRTSFHNDKILNILEGDLFGFSKSRIKKMVKDPTAWESPPSSGSVPGAFRNFGELFNTHNYFTDIQQVINEVILFKASKMAEMFGNQLTFPYMSTEIYDFLKVMPREYKYRGSMEDLAKGRGVSKFLHKNYLRQKLPDEITERKKQGGFAPLPIFFKNERRRQQLKDFILKSDAAGELFKLKPLQQFFAAYDKTAGSDGYWFWYQQVKAFQFFNLLVLAVWWEIFLNRKPPAELKRHFE